MTAVSHRVARLGNFRPFAKESSPEKDYVDTPIYQWDFYQNFNDKLSEAYVIQLLFSIVSKRLLRAFDICLQTFIFDGYGLPMQAMQCISATFCSES